MSTRMKALMRACFSAAFVVASLPAFAADEDFVSKAVQGGAAEVAAGNLAKSKGTAEPVKQFGSHMVTDHTQAGDELKAIATKKGMTLPDGPGDKHQKALAKLEGKSGSAFDKAFKKQMVDDHQDTIKLFEKEAKSGKDADLKAFAQKTLPTLKHHLDMAKALP